MTNIPGRSKAVPENFQKQGWQGQISANQHQDQSKYWMFYSWLLTASCTHKSYEYQHISLNF